MQSIRGSLSKLTRHQALPNEAQCPRCGYMDLSHPDVIRILKKRQELGDQAIMLQAACKSWATEHRLSHEAEMRWHQANLPLNPLLHKARTFENFEVMGELRAMYDACQQFARGEGPAVLVLVGPHGIGKSHLVEASVRHSLGAGKTARYEMTSHFVERLRHTFDESSDENLYTLMAWYQGHYLLGLDDLGLEKGTEFAREKLTVLVEERIRYRWRTIISTNATRDELAERLGYRLASRLYATNQNLGDVGLIVANAQDYRRAPNR